MRSEPATAKMAEPRVTTAERLPVAIQMDHWET
jgi:hypothetical protein